MLLSVDVCTLLRNMGGQNIFLCTCLYLHVLVRAHVEPCDPSISWCNVLGCNKCLWHSSSHVALFPAFPHPHIHVFMRMTCLCWAFFWSCSESTKLWCRDVKRNKMWGVNWMMIFSLLTKKLWKRHKMEEKCGELPIFDQKRDVSLREMCNFILPLRRHWIRKSRQYLYFINSLNLPSLSSSDKSESTSPLPLISVMQVLQLGHRSGSFSSE